MTMLRSVFNGFFFSSLVLSAVRTGNAAENEPHTFLKSEAFDRDPGWDNSVNRVEASDPPTVTQDFGWSPRRIGGTVWKSTTPAWYGMPLKRTLSFKDAFSASGRIAGFTVIKNIKSMTQPKHAVFIGIYQSGTNSTSELSELFT